MGRPNLITTRYDGPITISSLTFAETSVRVVRPAEPDRLLDAADVESWNRADDYMPYWAYLWPGAYLLSEAVAREPGLKGRSALEIGCGLGLAGLVGLARGMSVRFTDYDDTPLAFVSQSVAENRITEGQWSVGRLDWRELPAEKYDVILAADVLYERRLVPLVVNLLARMLTPEGIGLIAGPYRVATEDLAPQLDSADLIAEIEPVQSVEESGRAVRGTLHRVRRRHPS